MYKKTEIFDILINNKEAIFQYGVLRLGLFGSYSRNEQRKASDIDFIVEFDKDKKTFRNFMNLGFFLDTLFSIKVEIVTPESLSKFMKNRILKETEYVLPN